MEAEKSAVNPHELKPRCGRKVQPCHAERREHLGAHRERSFASLRMTPQKVRGVVKLEADRERSFASLRMTPKGNTILVMLSPFGALRGNSVKHSSAPRERDASLLHSLRSGQGSA